MKAVVTWTQALWMFLGIVLAYDGSLMFGPHEHAGRMALLSVPLVAVLGWRLWRLRAR